MCELRTSRFHWLEQSERRWQKRELGRLKGGGECDGVDCGRGCLSCLHAW